MRKKLLAVLAASAMLTGGTAAIAIAHPGPHHGHNDYGLCTAFKNIDDHAKDAPPFQDMDDDCDDERPDGEHRQD